MFREGFYIIRCPRCGRFTYAPTRQKTRLCVYCQRVFKINPLNAVFVEDAQTAQTRVKLYQTGKHHKEFMDAVEKSREKIESLLPNENVDLEQLQDPKQKIQPISARRRELERILYQHARTNTLDLQILEKECAKAGIPWNWAAQQIETLIRTGHLISPKPWQIQLVTDDLQPNDSTGKAISPTNLARAISDVLRKTQTALSQEEIISKLEKRGIASVGIDEALNRLRNQGYILKTSEGAFRWTDS
ncbi:MAG: hypothetical protein ACFFCH_01195 [Promethearchaeota archaeon]